MRHALWPPQCTSHLAKDDVHHDCWEFSRAYIDDVIVYSSTWEEHLEHLRQVFTCLRRANLSLKLSKCQFGLKQVEHLGHVIGDGVILPNPKKLEVVLHYKHPETKTEVKSFLGLTGYHRKFVLQYASISAISSRRGREREWNGRSPECEQAFQTLKKKLSEPLVLIVPDFSEPFVVQTDASNVGIGAVSLNREPGTSSDICKSQAKVTRAKLLCGGERVSSHALCGLYSSCTPTFMANTWWWRLTINR